MKKFLLSICCLFATVAMAYADEVKFDFTKNNYGMDRGNNDTNQNAPYLENGATITEGDITLTFHKNASSETGIRLWSDGLRFHKGQDAGFTVSISNGTISNITWTNKSGATFALDGTSDNITEWSGSATDVKFNYTNTSKNLALFTLTITYTKGSSSLKAAELSFPEKAYTITEGDVFESPVLSNPNNLSVEYTSTNGEVATVDNNGKVTVKGVGSTTISATSAATATFAAGKASYTLTVKAQLQTAKTLAEFLNMTPNKGDEARMGCELTVVYANGAYTYVKDETAASLIYSYDLNYKKGDVIPAGWDGSNNVYGGVYQIKPSADMPAATDNVEVSYPVIEDVTEANINQVVILKGVEFTKETPATKTNYKGTLANGKEFTFRNNFTIESIPAGKYDIEAVISAYNSTIQIQPIANLGVSAINEIAADNNATAKYFNLQGVSVDADNLTPGIYVRRQGNTVTKVIVK